MEQNGQTNDKDYWDVQQRTLLGKAQRLSVTTGRARGRLKHANHQVSAWYASARVLNDGIKQPINRQVHHFLFHHVTKDPKILFLLIPGRDQAQLKL